MLQYRGTAFILSDTDLPKLGHMIGVGEDEIHAILDVESAGSGFDKLGRLKALYEPHLAYAYSFGDTRNRLVAAGLAYPRWGTHPYPPDSYPRIDAASAVDEALAARATSWGLGQILGSNCKVVGYDTPQDMVAAFSESEYNQLRGVVQFLISNHLDAALRTHNWAALARGYNGAGYAKNHYDTHLAMAFRKWQLIPDTPWVPDGVPA